MASEEQTQQKTENSYPFLTQSDIENCMNDVEKLTFYNELKEKEVMGRINNFSLSTANTGVDLVAFKGETDELRIVVLGKTGHGKSATANTLLGVGERGDEGATAATGGVPGYFTEDYTAKSVTRVSRCITRKVDGRVIRIIDTPGLLDTNQTDETILKEIGRIMTIHDEGIHAFIYVMNMADPRFTSEDRKVLELLEVAFGGEFEKFCFLLFTRGYTLLKEKTLDEFHRRQLTEIPSTSEGSTSEETDADHKHDRNDFVAFLRAMTWRIFAVDNKAGTPFEHKYFRDMSFKIVDKMRFDNGQKVYTNSMFKRAQEEKEEQRQNGLRKGWDPEVMKIVDEIINYKPDVTKEELYNSVMKRLEHDRLVKVRELERREAEFKERMEQEEKRIAGVREEEDKKRQQDIELQMQELRMVVEQQMEQKQNEWEAEKRESENQRVENQQERAREQEIARMEIGALRMKIEEYDNRLSNRNLADQVHEMNAQRRQLVDNSYGIVLTALTNICPGAVGDGLRWIQSLLSLVTND